MFFFCFFFLKVIFGIIHVLKVMNLALSMKMDDAKFCMKRRDVHFAMWFYCQRSATGDIYI